MKPIHYVVLAIAVIALGISLSMNVRQAQEGTAVAKRMTCWDQAGKPFIDVVGTNLEWDSGSYASFTDTNGLAIEMRELGGHVCAVAPAAPAASPAKPAAAPTPPPPAVIKDAKPVDAGPAPAH